MECKKSSFFIIGAPKCGTTALYEWLKTHPDIFMPDMKEPHYYGDDLPGEIRICDDRGRYDALFECASNGQLCGEASVLYLYSQTAIVNILSDHPEAKFIVMLRHPVSMAQSWHNQALRVLREDIEDFETAWRQQEQRRKQNASFVLQYADICALGTQLERFYEQVPAAQRLVLFYDDLVNDPAALYGQVLSFLGVKPDERTDFDKINQSAALKNRALERLIKSTSHVFGFLKKPVNALGLRPLKVLTKINRRKTDKKELPETFKAELLQHFESDIQKIEKLTRRDLSHWR